MPFLANNLHGCTAIHRDKETMAAPSELIYLVYMVLYYSLYEHNLYGHRRSA